MTKHGLFGAPDKHGWFDYEKCPMCGNHWMSCDCGREKSSLEQKLEVASRADIITPIAAWTGVSPGCLILLCATAMALMIIVLSGE